MREYLRFVAEHSETTRHHTWSPRYFVGHLVHNLHARHVAQNLATLDDHYLADIGLSRMDVVHAAHAPLTRDALEELEHLRSQRREDPIAMPQDAEGLPIKV